MEGSSNEDQQLPQPTTQPGRKIRGPQKCKKCTQREGQTVFRKGHQCPYQVDVPAPGSERSISSYPPGEGPLSIASIARFPHAPASATALSGEPYDIGNPLGAQQEFEGGGRLTYPHENGLILIGVGSQSPHAPASATASTGIPNDVGGPLGGQQEYEGGDRPTYPPGSGLILIRDGSQFPRAPAAGNASFDKPNEAGEISESPDGPEGSTHPIAIDPILLNSPAVTAPETESWDEGGHGAAVPPAEKDGCEGNDDADGNTLAQIGSSMTLELPTDTTGALATITNRKNRKRSASDDKIRVVRPHFVGPPDVNPLDYISDKTKRTNAYSDRTDTMLKKCRELYQTTGAYVAFICARPETLSSGNAKSYLPPMLAGDDELSTKLRGILGDIGSVWQDHREADRSSRHDRISEQREKAKRAMEEKEAAEREVAIANAKLEQEQRARERLEERISQLTSALEVATDGITPV